MAFRRLLTVEVFASTAGRAQENIDQPNGACAADLAS